LASVLDALGQTKEYSYALDNRLTGTTYVDAVNPTPNVTYAYDPYYPRLTSMTDGTGVTAYTYEPVGSLGALQLAQESGPLTSSAITYTYDELGRLSSRAVAGAGAETFGYDTLGRLASHGSDLGAFTLAYLGQTNQIISRVLASSTLATTWSYLPNSGDRRLSQISNVGLSSGQYSTYDYTTTPENFITAIAEASDTSAVYPAVSTQTATYNDLNQLTNLSGQTLTWDADGNLLSDGARTYTWDAENRLIGIGYPSVSGKATAFTYDGLNRRVAITSTPAGGGSSVTTSYLWCSSAICQARNASNATTREYLSEGEYVPGSTPETDYYGIDQIGSVRRVFASTSSAPALSYDPYGMPLQTTTPVTDFNYAGMFANTDSGLYLTQYRAYDPALGRWISRDPLGEASSSIGNLYAYAGGNPETYVDPDGRIIQVLIPVVVGAGVGAGLDALGQLALNGGRFDCLDWKSIGVSAVLGGVFGGGEFAAARALRLRQLEALADDMAEWLGPNFSKFRNNAGDLRFRSLDNERQIRFDLNDFHGDPAGPHLNVETFKPRNLYPGDRTMDPIDNLHLYPKP
jgi:RHS repeat-associated protein